MRVLTDVKLDEAEWIQARLNQLNLIKEKRMTTPCHDQLYQKRSKKALNKKVHPQNLQVNDLVLKNILPIHTNPRGKWTPNYEGPYVVGMVFSGGAFILSTMDGNDLASPMNADIVRKYYA